MVLHHLDNLEKDFPIDKITKYLFNENFSCHTGCIAYPYGKIKIATPLIKD